MPVTVAKRGGKFRVVEPGGGVAKNRAGTAIDGGGYGSKSRAARQARAVNARKHAKKY